TIIMFSILIYETTGPIFSKYAIKKAGEINGLDKYRNIEDLEEENDVDIANNISAEERSVC
ncbi:MAG TPA: hypothetical protein DGK91_13475, partial [Clostridium sp.]|nr:hypothetical protein [Clostridium sp.]